MALEYPSRRRRRRRVVLFPAAWFALWFAARPQHALTLHGPRRPAVRRPSYLLTSSAVTEFLPEDDKAPTVDATVAQNTNVDDDEHAESKSPHTTAWPLLTPARFEASVRGALRGDARALTALASATGASELSWMNPVVGDSAGLDEAFALLNATGAFLESVRFDVVDWKRLDASTDGTQKKVGTAPEGGAVTTVEAAWVASATWPVPWRPRARCLGTSRLSFLTTPRREESAASRRSEDVDSDETKTESTVLKISDSWHAGPVSLFLRQIWPRFWDLWDLFGTPPVELPEILSREKLRGGFGVVTTHAAHLAKRVSLTDVTNSRSMRVASALPDFAFTAPYPSKRDARFDATPLRVSVAILPQSNESASSSPIGDAKNATGKASGIRRRIVWDAPIPSRHGPTYSDELPELPSGDDLLEATWYVDQGWAVDPALEYVAVPERVFLEADFDDDVQDPEADALRRRLVDAATKAGLPLLHDPAPLVVWPRGVKVIFDSFGNSVAAGYLQRQFPIDRGTLAIELHPSAVDVLHRSQTPSPR